ncbi:hypothetical protein EVAR_47795_1 [Eumeta japonica]|uniref:Uncharacterized protein n=1 Tax=Eumeta variegata TaxID=151549 RepID=A0A4C1Z944_EUMVA|nr:hypothetical protein EVAR_47795_1 [Eumeta japonica]
MLRTPVRRRTANYGCVRGRRNLMSLVFRRSIFENLYLVPPYLRTLQREEGTVALRTSLTNEGGGRTIIHSNDLGVGLGPMLGNCVGHRVLNTYGHHLRDDQGSFLDPQNVEI